VFTGIIESQGIVTGVQPAQGGSRLEVYAPDFGRDMAIGDSVAVDGACLTVVKFIRGAFLADVSGETLDRTTLGDLRQGAKVNLERALRMSDRLGGHLVSGHVDTVGRIALRQPGGNSVVYQFQLPVSIIQYVVPKGSIAIDGISLTVATIRGDTISCALVRHTEQVTTLGEKALGAPVNVEVDMLAKYVKRFVGLYAGQEAAPEAAPASLSNLLRDMDEGR
jgi:riboflavin synthase